MKYVIPDRGFVEIKGPNSLDFLERLITNSTSELQNIGSGVISLILTPQGRFLHELILINTGSTILIETKSEDIESLMKTIKFYSVSDNIKFRDASKYYKCYLLENDGEDISAKKKWTFQDPRLKNCQYRYRCILPAEDKISCKPYAEIEKHIKKYRISNMIVEPYIDILPNKPFPIEYGMERYIDFNKGCYVGQEVTSRMKNKPTSIKRNIFLMKSEEGQCMESLFAKDILLNGKIVGICRSCIDNIGIGLIDLRNLPDDITSATFKCDDIFLNITENVE